MTDLAITGIQSARVPPGLIFDLAMGLEGPATLFARYGYTLDQAKVLLENEFFKRQVETKAAELKSKGIIFQTKAALAAEDLLEDVYTEAKKGDTPLPQKLDALKFLAKAAGVDSVVASGPGAGGGFSITINLGDKTVQLSGEKIVNDE